MIYTITFNPALDYILQVDNFEIGKINRTKNEKILSGGKGLNVSIVLRNLGIKSTALGFIAGFTGDELKRDIEQRGIETDFIKVSNGITRINVKNKFKNRNSIKWEWTDSNRKRYRNIVRQNKRDKRRRYSYTSWKYTKMYK